MARKKSPPRPRTGPPTHAGTPEDGLARWLNDVVTLHARAVRAGLRVEVVHDLRVAIRRCRSLAQGLREIDDDVGAQRWRALSDAGRALFQGLGDLRDAQVMREHAERLLAEDPSRDNVLGALDRRIAQTKEGARAAVNAFDAVAWKAAALGLPARADELLRERPLFDHLALRRFFEARELHQAAMRSKGSTALHDLRIGVKKLRYTVENFLPRAHKEIGKLLKRMQEVLGDLHDLDVLIAFLASEHIALHSNDRSRTATLVRSARDDKVAAYRAMTTTTTSSTTSTSTSTSESPPPDAPADAPAQSAPTPESPQSAEVSPTPPAWTRIRAAFVDGRDVDRAHDALIERRTRSRSDVTTSRALLRASFELLRAFRNDAKSALKALADPRAPILLRRACMCALVDGGGKPARAFVDDLPLAVGFGERERSLLAAVVRAPIDKAPAVDDKRIVALPARDRALALCIGALLHLAAPLVATAPFVVRKGRDVVVLDSVRPIASTPEAAREFALRRAPFEALLGVPLWSKAAPLTSTSTSTSSRARAKASPPRRPPRSRSLPRAPRASRRAPAGAHPSA